MSQLCDDTRYSAKFADFPIIRENHRCDTAMLDQL